MIVGDPEVGPAERPYFQLPPPTDNPNFPENGINQQLARGSRPEPTRQCGLGSPAGEKRKGANDAPNFLLRIRRVPLGQPSPGQPV
jgi:hypothetical protein